MKKNLNLKKLLNSKWTKVRPTNKEKHFTVIKVEKCPEDHQKIIGLTLQALLTKNIYEIKRDEIHQFKEDKEWLQGWK